MKNVQSIALKGDSNEELLPDFSADFPYIASCAELDKYIEPVVPWHWHGAVELFYMESGEIEYATPNGTWVFLAGSGGMVNANVLHTSRILQQAQRNIQLLHLFDARLISGESGCRMDARYVRPLETNSAVELIPLYPDVPDQARLLGKIRAAFDLDDGEWGYEFRLRAQLSDIWLDLLKLAPPMAADKRVSGDAQEKIKQMMRYIRQHFQETISVDQLAAAAHVSRRACFRLFQTQLHVSPAVYMRSFRLQRARRMLVENQLGVTEIAYECGFASAGYFAKAFKAEFGCSPEAYRKACRARNPTER